ncbi:TFIIB-type zinc ribbon-containing protein [Agromyces sp. ZXT2-6]|uniref:TFIIB-type zinc ribbon-containing protein n=1 Tax=Agromyces sp. ZXT2-6 TaxID=3461153 RepID=UPI004054BA33
MQCPTDGAVLVMSERSGIEIDYCPACRGVWLDRGELDKIIERAAREFGQSAPAAPAVAPQAAPQQPAPQQQGYPANPMDVLRRAGGGYDDRRDDQRGYDQRGYDQGYSRKPKKDNWLSELFD